MNASALLTDLYQLTMAACYFDQDMQAEATFSLFIRKYPAQRSYFVAAGLPEVLQYLETLRFTDDDLALSRLHRPLSEPPSWTSCKVCALPARSGPCRKAASFSKMSPSWK